MKIATSILAALFLASAATAAMPDDPAKIDTCVKPGVVAWTFDDGPGVYNDQLLALLARKNVKATFFVLGSMIDANPQQAGALKKILAGGHQLASHTYSHSNLDAMTEDAMRLEISRTSDTMFANAGVRPAYMRAPEGRCAEACTKVMEGLGLVISHWNVDTNDWRFKNDPANVAADKSMVDINKYIVQESNPATDSFILLQHEIHKFSVDLVAERVIDTIIAKGYRFVTMEECIGKPSYLTGSVVPPTVAPPAANTTAPVVPPTATGVVPPPAGGTTGAPQKTSGAAVPSATAGKGVDSGASLVRAGAWAMGVAAAVGFAML
jgi:peptidoglycan/xylan/chitin deacetylase (PgdA/CDA1 family)